MQSVLQWRSIQDKMNDIEDAIYCSNNVKLSALLHSVGVSEVVKATALFIECNVAMLDRTPEQIEMCKLLINRLSELDGLNRRVDGYSLIDLAIINFDINTVTELVRRGADVTNCIRLCSAIVASSSAKKRLLQDIINVLIITE